MLGVSNQGGLIQGICYIGSGTAKKPPSVPGEFKVLSSSQRNLEMK